MDLTPVDIVGKRCYQFIHAEDVEGIRQSHLDCEYCDHLASDSTLIGQSIRLIDHQVILDTAIDKTISTQGPVMCLFFWSFLTVSQSPWKYLYGN